MPSTGCLFPVFHLCHIQDSGKIFNDQVVVGLCPGFHFTGPFHNHGNPYPPHTLNLFHSSKVHYERATAHLASEGLRKVPVIRHEYNDGVFGHVIHLSQFIKSQAFIHSFY